MFTGIVEEVGKMKSLKKQGEMMKLKVSASKILEDIQLGDSIATNGVCLTVTDFDKNSFTADVMPETVRKTNLRNLKPDSGINLERAMTPSKRLGGHIMTGHIDGIGTMVDKKKDEKALVYTFKISELLSRYMVQKGSIAIDGVSLTIIDAENDWFSIGLIPHTAGETILGELKEGDEVNLEVDIIAKYVEKLLGREDNEGAEGYTNEGQKSKLTLENLRELGY
ncbi:riboflavin synthase [Natranaerofaba carboxydovora]|uniref:riboflavin synthase n=1 Tax=Natranaerofaba carboxydovora TaxID=2742683 RepID=UPI001F13B22E|nr:riboflavin synthase [Natranaerofaba carboxydovora]UMZ75320.1 Riboflavin synthase [Natranaerofaba carboxydovora]